MNYHSTWHLFHLIMSILTGGIWCLVWLWRTLANSSHNQSVEMNLMKQQVDEMKRINRGVDVS